MSFLLLFVSFSDFHDEHFPLISMQFLKKLLVNLKDADNNILFIFQLSSAVIYRIVKAIGVYI